MLNSLKNLGTVLKKEELKFIMGSKDDRFGCTVVYNYCDSHFPDNYAKFAACMEGGGC